MSTSPTAGSAEIPESTKDDWDTHWSSFSESSEVNPAVLYRGRLILNAMKSALHRSGARYLDIGCGTGELVAAATGQFAELTARGIDYSSTGVRMAGERSRGSEFLCADLSKPVAPPAEWAHWANVATCCEVIEHVDDPVAFLGTARQFLEPGCQIYVSVPGGPMSAYDHHIGHRTHFTRPQLRAVLEGAGFEVEAVDGVGFPFFNLYRLVVVLRGRRLIADASTNGGEPGLLLRAVSRVFEGLFRLNTRRGRLGWQLIARARLPA